jgi:ubiquinone/menaquinone biosynthesis C-methylase UbiE
MGTEEGPHGGAAEPIDLAVFNASLHYSRDCGVTLREALRVLSPDGVLVVMDSPVYRQEASGEQMVHERERAFQRTYGFRSDSLRSEHFLTAARLQELARDLTLRWRMYAPVDGPGRRGLPGRVGTPLVGAFRARWRRLRGLREQAQMPVIVGYHAGNRRCAVERQKRISDPSGNPEGTWSCAGAEPDPLTRVLCRPPSGGTGGRGSRAPVSVAEAYDAIAPEYDRQVDDDAWMRRILWRQYAQAFRPGHHVLDVGCGTGTDAVFLARRGVRVTAIDISPAMIARAEGKVAGCGLSAGVRLAVLDIGELGRLPADEFDGIISSFAALNTLPTLTQFGADAARLLRPHGRMILHLLNGSSLHEWAGLMAHGRWTEAWRLGRRRERTFGVGGRPVRHYMPRAEEAYALYFAPHFRLHCARGLGIVRPPCHLGYPATGSAARRWSIPEAALTALGRLDELVGPTHPFVDWGRSVLLEMVRDGS